MNLENNVIIIDKGYNYEDYINFIKIGRKLARQNNEFSLLTESMDMTSISYFHAIEDVRILAFVYNMKKLSIISSRLGFDINDIIISFFEYITQENYNFYNFDINKIIYLEPNILINFIMLKMGIDSSVNTIGEYLTFTYNKLTGSNLTTENVISNILNGMTGFNDTSIVYMNTQTYENDLTEKILNKEITHRDIDILNLSKKFFKLDINPCLSNWFYERDRFDWFEDVNILSNTFNLILLNHIFNKEIKDIFNTHDSSHIKFKRDDIIEFYGTRECKDSDINLIYVNQRSDTAIVGSIVKLHNGIKFEIECKSKVNGGNYNLYNYSRIFNLTTNLLSFIK